MDSGSEKSNPGIPSGGIFLPLVYSKKSSDSSDTCFFSSARKTSNVVRSVMQSKSNSKTNMVLLYGFSWQYQIVWKINAKRGK